MFDVPLLHVHKDLGATLGEFAGWQVPMNYGSVIDEHKLVRSSVGLFDISHMGRILVQGKDSPQFLDKLIAKNIMKLKPGKAIMPTAMLNEHGGFIDDVTVYMMDQTNYLIVCNAINREKVIKWMRMHSNNFNVNINDITFDTAMFAVQGPKALEFMSKYVTNAEKLGIGDFVLNVNMFGVEIFMLSGGGWTGEKGYEIIVKKEVAEKLYKSLINEGLNPVGIIARDTLRLEAGFLLYGSDIDEHITPLEARYWVFTLKKSDYIGKQALEKQLKEGVSKVRIGLVIKDRSPIPRHGSKVLISDVEVGYVTSGGYSPILEKNIAMAYMKPTHALIGGSVDVEIRGKTFEAKIVDFPFVRGSLFQ
jgi:aminomethyltransferase